MGKKILCLLLISICLSGCNPINVISFIADVLSIVSFFEEHRERKESEANKIIENTNLLLEKIYTEKLQKNGVIRNFVLLEEGNYKLKILSCDSGIIPRIHIAAHDGKTISTVGYMQNGVCYDFRVPLTGYVNIYLYDHYLQEGDVRYVLKKILD